jgi:hypothetical protein
MKKAAGTAPRKPRLKTARAQEAAREEAALREVAQRAEEIERQRILRLNTRRCAEGTPPMSRKAASASIAAAGKQARKAALQRATYSKRNARAAANTVPLVVENRLVTPEGVTGPLLQGHACSARKGRDGSGYQKQDSRSKCLSPASKAPRR